uniref:Uncharacterized protein n=1 Tax=Chlamydia pneumoniae TaxID=83558 RepID=A0A0F7WUZ7_CHLPN|nr:Uncharacterized protein BN1224_DC9_AL_00020 [Chlamydia pneumoniae]
MSIDFLSSPFFTMEKGSFEKKTKLTIQIKVQQNLRKTSLYFSSIIEILDGL